MNKYIFNLDLLGTLVGAGIDTPRGSWSRTTAELMQKPAYQLSAAEGALVAAMTKKILNAWYNIHEMVETHDATNGAPYVYRTFWPTNADEDFLIMVQTRHEYDSNRYPVIEGRHGYGYNMRANNVAGKKLVSAAAVQDELKTKIQAWVGDAPLSVEVKEATFPAGSQLVSVVYKQPEDQARKPWMDAARWPLEIISTQMAESAILTKERGQAKIVQASDLSEPMVPASFTPGSGDRIKADIELLAGNMQERIVNARNAYYAEVRARMRANVTETNQIKQRTAEEIKKSREAFGVHRKSHKQKLAESLKGKEAIAMLPFIGHGFASSRRWGIEIESGGARGIEAPKGWKRKGDGSLRSAWDGWVNDGSLGEIMIGGGQDYCNPEDCPTGENHSSEIYDSRRGYITNPTYNPDCDRCGYYMVPAGPAPIGHRFSSQSDDRAEFVSPILGSMHSNGLETLLAQIIQQPQNDSAGVHVHVEATDLTPKQLGSLVYGYDRIEGLIESSYRRTKREYCKLRNDNATLDILKSAKTAKRLLDVPAGDRYVTLNLCSLSAHGTVEFRAMGNVYDYEYLSRWAMFCREMVNIAKAGVTAKEWNSVQSWADVTALFAKYGKEYIRAVMDTMGEEVPSSPRLKRDGSVSMPTGTEATSEIAVSGSTFADLIATMEEEAVNSRWITTVEQSIAGITSESSQRVLVGALASGETEV